MGEIEDELRQQLDMAAKATPAGLRALTEGPQEVTDPIGELVLPMLAAQREAILRLARAIDDLG